MEEIPFPADASVRIIGDILAFDPAFHTLVGFGNLTIVIIEND